MIDELLSFLSRDKEHSLPLAWVTRTITPATGCLWPLLVDLEISELIGATPLFT